MTVIYRVTAIRRFPFNSTGIKLTCLCGNTVIMQFTFDFNSNAINKRKRPLECQWCPFREVQSI